MKFPRILALSSSRVGNSSYLESAIPFLKDFLGDTSLRIAFVPFASVDEYAEYLDKVREGLSELNHSIDLVEPGNAKNVLENCDVVMVGGGNTFKLLHDLYALDVIEIIRLKVGAGTPYVGWSAGANITGRSISTTNDMPIIEPQSFKALNFFQFQINPHYLNVKADGHHGETRDQRLEEFIKMNPTVPVIGLPEGSALILNQDQLNYVGYSKGVLFSSVEKNKSVTKKEIESGANLTHFL